MSTASGLQEMLRRRSVGAQAQVAVEASMAAMAIRALKDRPRTRLGPRPDRALRSVLGLIDQVADYRDNDLLPRFVRDDHVTAESLEGIQVMARVARHANPPSSPDSFPTLDSMIASRAAVEVDPRTRKIRVKDKQGASKLADSLDQLASDLVSVASAEDRGRTSQFAVS